MTADVPGNDVNASMLEQVKRPNPWRKMMMMMMTHTNTQTRARARARTHTHTHKHTHTHTHRIDTQLPLARHNCLQIPCQSSRTNLPLPLSGTVKHSSTARSSSHLVDMSLT